MRALLVTTAIIAALLIFQLQPVFRSLGLVPEEAPPFALLLLIGLLAFTGPLLFRAGRRTTIPGQLILLLLMPTLHIPISYFVSSHTAFVGGVSLALQMLAFVGICSAVEATTWNSHGIARFLWALDALTALIAVTVIHSYFFPDLYAAIGEVQMSYVKRAFGVTGDQAGWMLAFVSIINLTRRRWILVALGTSGLLFTGQVGALLMLAVGFAWVLLMQGHAVLAATQALVFALAIGLLLVGGADSIPVLQRYSQTLFETGGSVSMRFFAMAIGVEMFLQSPILGSGFGTYSYNAFAAHALESADIGIWLSNPTNQWLQFLCDFGVLFSPILLYCLVNIAMRLKALQNPSAPFVRGVFVAFVCLLVTNHSAVYFLPSVLMTLVVTYLCLAFASGRLPARQGEHLPAYPREPAPA